MFFIKVLVMDQKLFPLSYNIRYFDGDKPSVFRRNVIPTFTNMVGFIFHDALSCGLSYCI